MDMKKSSATMSDVRFKMWKVKTGKAIIVSATKLMYLPQTNESFQPNVPRAHLQCCIWKYADEATPPDIDPTMHGRKKDAINTTLTQILLPANTPASPVGILQLISVVVKVLPDVHVLAPCSLLPCTIFCGYEGGLDCSIEHTKTAVEDIPNDADDHLAS